MEPCLNRPPANGHSMRVLLVEDEKKVASFVARALREDTYAVDVAENGQKALELATDRKERRVGKECRSRWSPYH